MAIEIIPNKICKYCGGIKWYRHIQGHCECSFCKSNTTKKWLIRNKEHVKLSQKQYHQTPEGKAAGKRAYITSRDNVSNHYAYTVLFNNCKHDGTIINSNMVTLDHLQKQRETILLSRKLKEFNKQLKSEKIMETATIVKSSKEKRSQSMKDSWEKRKAKQSLNTESLNQLTNISIVGSDILIKNPEYVRRAQAARMHKQAKLAIISNIVISPIGALESLLNDFNNLKNKKQEILNHLKAIEQLINQF